MTPNRVMTPWTPQQVRALNGWQGSEWVVDRARFVCQSQARHLARNELIPRLVASEDGWRCPGDGCGFNQDWAFAFMAMDDHMVGWGVECKSCAGLLDRCYDADMRRELAEDRVASLEAEIRKIKEEYGVPDGQARDDRTQAGGH